MESFKLGLAEILHVDPEHLVEDLQLGENNWDSLALLGAIALIDENFGISISEGELDRCTSVGSLLKLIDFHVAKEGATP